MCPTPEWLLSSYGNGEYELRLKSGNRVLCMVGVDTGPGPVSAPARTPADPGPSVRGEADGMRRGSFQQHRRR